MASPTVTELAARIAALEAKLSPEPLVLTPPITIGSFTNVPAPGSQLAAQWAQDATSYLIHRFANKAALDAWAAPNGSLAVTTDLGISWRRAAGAWSQQSPWTQSIAGNPLTSSGIALNVQTPFAALNIPADPATRIGQISAFVRCNVFATVSLFVILKVDGVVQAQASIPTTIQIQSPGAANMDWNIALSTGDIALPTGRTTPVAVYIQQSTGPIGAGAWSVGTAKHENRLDALVLPKGY